MKRKPLGKSSSRKIFKKNLGKHAANSIRPALMRGGFRL